MFRSEIGSGFEDPGGTPPPRIPRSTPPGRLGLQWRFIHLPLKNHDERIECRLYTQFHKTAKCFKSTLYLLLSLPFGEEMYPIEKPPVGSLLYVQNRKRSFLSRSIKTIDRSPCCSHQATTEQHFSFKKHGGEASHCSSCEAF